MTDLDQDRSFTPIIQSRRRNPACPLLWLAPFVESEKFDRRIMMRSPISIDWVNAIVGSGTVNNATSLPSPPA